MKIELKDFQAEAARNILEEMDDARTAARRGKWQAVVLSAPTGSGKTITVAAVIDWTFGGADGIAARPNTTFLWLSDSPELNAQSRAKLLAACDHLPYHRMVPVDSDSFDEERLHPGCVYFINTQLLGKDKRLTMGGDKKQFTFWQTVANTIAAAPEDFILIIDEAHRGAGSTDRARKPIMQKFITGSDEDGLPPVPLVLGMSATPQRFTELLGTSSRTQRPVNISPEMVRSSGLLKDLIVVSNPKESVQTDLTLLENAATRWKEFSELWSAYCTREKEKETVKPILVVQVEDGNENAVTRTPLNDVVRVIERQTGPLALNEIVHCFQDQQELKFGGRIIRKIDASRIQDAGDVKVVLFKTALTTGWDCPRAEVMMSFRRAQDPTSIAQLVGRMIRTPLARRIESDEVLNTVDLYLPHYDADTLESVLARLRKPDEQEGLPAQVATDAINYPRSPEFADVFEHLSKLPTYSVDRAPKMSELKRALRLAGMLVHEGIAPEADEEVRAVLVAKLNKLREEYAASDPNWIETVHQSGEIEVEVTAVAIGTMSVSGSRTTRLALNEENIDQLFDAAGRILAAGEGLHRTYWKRYHDPEKPSEAKLELFAVTRQATTFGAMESVARGEFDKLWASNREKVKSLPASDRDRFQKLMRASGKPVQLEWELPDRIVERNAKVVWKNHLYSNATGDFAADLNVWESEFLSAAMEREGFVCWLRNLPRREWAFCVPYDMGGEKPFYPDFVVVRKVGDGYVVDILEPHDDGRLDTWAKVRGLARFADDHHMDFGRLIVGRKKDGILQVVDVSDARIREKARKMTSPNDLEALFERDSDSAM